jgi:hypothetical protein
MCEPHLDLLALAPRLLEALCASERPGDVSGMLMDVARDQRAIARRRIARKVIAPTRQFVF